MRLWKRSPDCAACGTLTVWPSFEADHVIPLHQGGADDESNLQTLCIDCHKAKTRQDASLTPPGALRPRGEAKKF